MAKLCSMLERNSDMPAEEIQARLNISRRTFFRYLEELRAYGAHISYEKRKNSYKLENDFDVLEYCSKELV